MKVMEDREDNKEAVNFYFYQKHMTNKNVLNAYNGKPIRMVISTLIKERMRRMRNTSPSLLPDKNRELFRTFNFWMAICHRIEDFRIQITIKVITNLASRMQPMVYLKKY